MIIFGFWNGNIAYEGKNLCSKQSHVLEVQEGVGSKKMNSWKVQTSQLSVMAEWIILQILQNQSNVTCATHKFWHSQVE